MENGGSNPGAPHLLGPTDLDDRQPSTKGETFETGSARLLGDHHFNQSVFTTQGHSSLGRSGAFSGGWNNLGTIYGISRIHWLMTKNGGWMARSRLHGKIESHMFAMDVVVFAKPRSHIGLFTQTGSGGGAAQSTDSAGKTPPNWWVMALRADNQPFWRWRSPHRDFMHRGEFRLVEQSPWISPPRHVAVLPVQSWQGCAIYVSAPSPTRSRSLQQPLRRVHHGANSSRRVGFRQRKLISTADPATADSPAEPTARAEYRS
jgi:hypothetical protein